MDDRETFDALAAEMSPEGTSLVMQIMQRNRDASDSAMNSLLEGMTRERDEWRARALRAERIAKRMEHNVLAMLYGEPQQQWVE